MSKPMTLNEIAIDDEMNQMRDRIQYLIRERDEARADNARLTARVAELEANRDMWKNLAESSQVEYGELYASTLTPRNCDTCKRAAEAMRNSASHARTDMNTDDVLGWENMTAEERRMWRAGYVCGTQDMHDSIIALPLPSFGVEQCAGCAPLKPE